MNRRSFLFGTSTLLISQLLGGCNSAKQPKLTVQLLNGSIPGRILKQFQSEAEKSLSQKIQLKFSPVVQLRELFKKLESSQQNKTAAKKPEGFNISHLLGQTQPQTTDLSTLGDFWLQEAIKKGLIQPLSPENLENWSELSPKWQELVKRNDGGLVDDKGKIWAAPYRWGSTVIIYRRDKLDKFDWELQDWSDLFREELTGKISLLNQPREVVGLTLKKLGKSYNTENLKEVPLLEAELQKLNKQVKFYNSVNYIEPLILGDTWVALAWSNDVVSILSRYPQLSVMIPNSGTVLWADLWVQPVGEVEKDLSSKWINFCWKPEIAKQIALLTKSNSPIDTDIKKSDIPERLQELQIKPQVFDNSEFLLPLPESVDKEYLSLFNKMKTG